VLSASCAPSLVGSPPGLGGLRLLISLTEYRREIRRTDAKKTQPTNSIWFTQSVVLYIDGETRKFGSFERTDTGNPRASQAERKHPHATATMAKNLAGRW